MAALGCLTLVRCPCQSRLLSRHAVETCSNDCDDDVTSLFDTDCGDTSLKGGRARSSTLLKVSDGLVDLVPEVFENLVPETFDHFVPEVFDDSVPQKLDNGRCESFKGGSLEQLDDVDQFMTMTKAPGKSESNVSVDSLTSTRWTKTCKVYKTMTSGQNLEVGPGPKTEANLKVFWSPTVLRGAHE